jgi:hypothetical protein
MPSHRRQHGERGCSALLGNWSGIRVILENLAPRMETATAWNSGGIRRFTREDDRIQSLDLGYDR